MSMQLLVDLLSVLKCDLCVPFPNIRTKRSWNPQTPSADTHFAINALEVSAVAKFGTQNAQSAKCLRIKQI